MDTAKQELIDAALAMASSLEWYISDSGHAGVRCDPDSASDLFDAANTYKKAAGIPLDKAAKRQAAIRGLGSLVRR